TMNCHRSADGEESPRGAVAWTELSLERAVDEHPKPPTEAEQDEVRLMSDDQLFGHILEADRRALQFDGGFGKRSLRWNEVAGCSFRRPAASPAKAGAKV